MTQNELKPFRLLPYGAKFCYQDSQDVWVRIGHNVVASWPCKLWSPDGTPCQSLCCFCHLDNDEDDITLNTPVKVIEP